MTDERTYEFSTHVVIPRSMAAKFYEPIADELFSFDGEFDSLTETVGKIYDAVLAAAEKE